MTSTVYGVNTIPGSRLEFWPPNELGTKERPRPKEAPLGVPFQEVPKGADVVDVRGDVASHWLIKTDPVLKAAYEKFRNTLTIDQQLRLVKQYSYATKKLGEKRPFDKWLEISGLPGYFRGYAFGQWPNDRITPYTPGQVAMFERMNRYLLEKFGDN